MGENMDIAQRMPAAEPAQKIVYDGRLGPLYGIFIKNLLLNIITLSIYRFWGKTNLRRYIWSHMRFQGEALEYTGTGGELFIGFLIVIGLLIVTQIGIAILHLAAGSSEAFGSLIGLIFGAVVVYLTMVAIYAAQRYRLTRTVWRGIRGGMTGSAWSFGLRAIVFNLLAGLTLSLAGPWARIRLAEIRINNSYFGDAKAYLNASAGKVFLSYLTGLAIYLVIVGAAGFAIWTSFDLTHVLATMLDAARTQNDSNPETLHLVGRFIAAYGLFLLVFIAAGTFAFCWYAAAFFRVVASGLTFADLSFRSTMGPGDYLRLWLGNILILLVTLGFGLPIVIHRSLRFFADRLEIIGNVDVERLRQNTLPKPRTGEGLLETFDPGFW